MNKRIVRYVAAVLLLAAFPFALMANGVVEGPINGTGELVVLHTNDFHGHPLNPQ